MTDYERLQADARRYRWLRLRMLRSDVDELAFDYPAGTEFKVADEIMGQEIDRAIDRSDDPRYELTDKGREMLKGPQE